MKLYKSFLYAATLMLGLTACDEKSLWDGQGSEQGELYLSVSAQSPQSLTRAAVNTADFNVGITGLDGLSNIVRNYDKVSDMPSVINLPVGNYLAEAHTPGALEKQMTAPYYKGSKVANITADVTSTHEIACKMANSRISVAYADDFLAKFKSWTVTVDDGSDHVLTYTNAEVKPADIYWYFEENTVKEVSVNIAAVTNDGTSVVASQTLTKTNSTEGYTEIENEYFGGGDAIAINIAAATNPNGTLTGITIKTNISFENFDDVTTIEVIDNASTDPVVPEEPGADIVIVTNYPAEGVSATYGQTENLPDVRLDFTFPTGLQHLYVKVSGSDDFEFACGLMGLTSGDGLDLVGGEAQALADLFKLPAVGDKNYSFTLNETLWALLASDPGYPGVQTFTLKAVDQNGATKSGELIITINQ
ncbi:MAG: DUF4493 domain-containing protein [Bacteroidaceae bacterium]|nr:DUF4493 domain-containing protein [Bacteroidaceae bacterium]